MPKDIEDILNEPIRSDDFKSDDFPNAEKEKDQIDPNDEDVNLEDDEIDPVGDMGLGDDEFDSELNDDSLDLPDEQNSENIEDSEDEEQFIAPEEQVRWTVVPQENGDIWVEHIDGFILRARPLSAQKGPQIKYAAQLFKDNKIIEKGVIWIDKNTDQIEYLQNVADRILDRMGLTNLSKMTAIKDNVDEL